MNFKSINSYLYAVCNTSVDLVIGNMLDMYRSVINCVRCDYTANYKRYKQFPLPANHGMFIALFT